MGFIKYCLLFFIGLSIIVSMFFASVDIGNTFDWEVQSWGIQFVVALGDILIVVFALSLIVYSIWGGIRLR